MGLQRGTGHGKLHFLVRGNDCFIWSTRYNVSSYFNVKKGEVGWDIIKVFVLLVRGRFGRVSGFGFGIRPTKPSVLDLSSAIATTMTAQTDNEAGAANQRLGGLHPAGSLYLENANADLPYREKS
jgi:hypothetical protein